MYTSTFSPATVISLSLNDNSIITVVDLHSYYFSDSSS